MKKKNNFGKIILKILETSVVSVIGLAGLICMSPLVVLYFIIAGLTAMISDIWM